LSMNNSTLYRSQSNNFTRAVHISLMGDPTLRMNPVSPPIGLSVMSAGGGVTLNWQDSADTVLGYHVYRSPSSSGPFARLTSSPVAGKTFTDNTVSSNTYTYMVRAVTLQTTPSGSYYNASQGAFVPLDSASISLPIQLFVVWGANGPHLCWNSQSGTGYRVLTKTNLSQIVWIDASGSITATGSNTVWSDTNLSSLPRRFYRIASP